MRTQSKAQKPTKKGIFYVKEEQNQHQNIKFSCTMQQQKHKRHEIFFITMLQAIDQIYSLRTNHHFFYNTNFINESKHKSQRKRDHLFHHLGSRAKRMEPKRLRSFPNTNTHTTTTTTTKKKKTRSQMGKIMSFEFTSLTA